MPFPLLLLFVLPAFGAESVCEVASPPASFSVPHVTGAQELNTDPHSATWSHAASTWIVKDCTHTVDYPKIKTEVRGFWTDSDLYLLFICPYTALNLWLPADNSQDRLKLWDRDVVEFFLGDDWKDIKHYREFEIAPTGDWVDLAIDLNKESYDAKWNSGWQRQGDGREEPRLVRSGARSTEIGERAAGESRNEMASKSLPYRRPWRRSATAFHVLAAHLRGQPRS